MIIERLFEAVIRLAKASGKPFENVSIQVSDQHYAIAHGNTNQGKVFKRRSTVSVLHRSNWVSIGTADVDINGMVLGIQYDDAAPWWAVKPFQEAMEGK